MKYFGLRTIQTSALSVPVRSMPVAGLVAVSVFLALASCVGGGGGTIHMKPAPVHEPTRALAPANPSSSLATVYEERDGSVVAMLDGQRTTLPRSNFLVNGNRTWLDADRSVVMIETGVAKSLAGYIQGESLIGIGGPAYSGQSAGRVTAEADFALFERSGKSIGGSMDLQIDFDSLTIFGSPNGSLSVNGSILGDEIRGELIYDNSKAQLDGALFGASSIAAAASNDRFTAAVAGSW